MVYSARVLYRALIYWFFIPLVLAIASGIQHRNLRLRAAAEEAARLAELARTAEIERVKAEAKSAYIATTHLAQLVVRERRKKLCRIAVYGYEAEWAFEEVHGLRHQ